MKTPILIFGLMSHALAASFYDEFRGAITSVERGFGKLITDVVTDVKDTIHCTLSAVEQVLVLKGVLDKTSTYDYRCRNIARQKNSPFYRRPIDRVKNFNFPSHREFSPRHISMELKSSIVNTNRTINDILNRPIDIDVTDSSKVLQEETRHLVEISELLKSELQKLSSNARTKTRSRYFDHRLDSVESLWSEIKTLHDIQKTSNNDVEVKEIRHVLDKIVNKLDLTPNHHSNAGIYNIEDIKMKLHRLSNKNVNQIYSTDPIIQHIRLRDSQYKSQNSKDMPKSFKEAAEQIVSHNKVERKISDNFLHTEKSVFDLDSDDFANFSPFTNANSNQKDVVDDAKELIKSSKHTDQVLNKFFENHKAGVDVFSNSNLFSFS